MATARLPRCITNVTVHAMYTVARFLQIAGLTILPLAIMAQLNQNISLGQMLQFLVVAVRCFLNRLSAAELHDRQAQVTAPPPTRPMQVSAI